MWELAAAVDGFNRSQGGDKRVEPPSNDEFDSMLENFHSSQLQ